MNERTIERTTQNICGGKKIYRISYDFFYINQRDTLGENENFRPFGIVCNVHTKSYTNSCLFLVVVISSVNFFRSFSGVAYNSLLFFYFHFPFSFFFSAFEFAYLVCAQRTLQQQCRTRYFYLILLIACAVDAAVCEFYSS